MKLMRIIAATLFALAAAVAAHAADGYKVIVNNDNERASIAKEDLSQIFMKKKVHWDGGTTPIVPVDLHERSATREAFTAKVHGKRVAAVKSYWQQQIFSGRDIPPVEKASEAQVVAFVRQNPGAVGYVADGTDTAGVRVLTVLP